MNKYSISIVISQQIKIKIDKYCQGGEQWEVSLTARRSVNSEITLENHDLALKVDPVPMLATQ